VVLVINVAIFLGEYGAGWYGHSTALQSDSLDSLGDALVYGISLWVAAKSLRARAGAALLKGAIQVLFALGVVAEVIHKWIHGAPPLPSVMQTAAALALAGNVACLSLLSRFRSDDINMRSVWLCSRNDVIGNAGVLIIAGLIGWTHWAWLDLLFGAAMAVLFLWTGMGVLRTSWPQFRAGRSDHEALRIIS
jgi:Co/Zn/Cd efflux system component